MERLRALFWSRRHPWSLVVLWSALIFAASSIPGPQMPIGALPFLRWDKAMHALVFAGFGALTVRALLISKPGSDRGRLAILAVLATIAYGCTDELHQMFTPGRVPSGLDIVADGAGGVFGVSVVFMSRALLRRR